MIKVRIWQDKYYPGGYQLIAVSEKITRKIINRAVENGMPFHGEMTTVVERNKESLPRMSTAKMEDLESGWPVTVLMDGWEFAHYYGYDAHTVFEGR